MSAVTVAFDVFLVGGAVLAAALCVMEERARRWRP